MEAPGHPDLNVSSGSAIVGLTEALQLYFDRWFETRRNNGGKACPGEEICVVTGPLRDKSRPIEVICAACPLVHTKPGSQPGHLSNLIIEVIRLDELKQSGATFQYPDTLSPLEWACLQALHRARAKAEDKDMQARRAAAQQQSEQQRIERRVKQG